MLFFYIFNHLSIQIGILYGSSGKGQKPSNKEIQGFG
jgi:hypothetical protein